MLADKERFGIGVLPLFHSRSLAERTMFLTIGVFLERGIFIHRQIPSW